MTSTHQADIVVTSDWHHADLGFTDFVNRLKSRYQQVANHLDIICRIDIDQPKLQRSWVKTEKTIDSILREITTMTALIGVSIKGYEDEGKYFIQITANLLHSKPRHKIEGISTSLIVEAELRGINIRTNSRTNTKLSYDFSI